MSITPSAIPQIAPPVIPTFEKLDYRIRPAKNVERKMICEALGRLAGSGKLNRYQYVGFGSIGFHCFSLFHQRLGISDMVSIEGSPASDELSVQERFEKNKPYSCIKVRFGKSNAVLPTLNLEQKRSIIWLDYEGPIDDVALADTAQIASKVPPGSILLVTLNVHVKNNADGTRACMNHLNKVIATDMIRPGVKQEHLAGTGYAKVCANILADLVKNTLNDRNTAHPDKTIIFKRLFNFVYQDGALMMTFGGIFGTKQRSSEFGTELFEDLPFVCTGEEQYEINIPYLTLREIKYLDSLLPRRSLAGKTPKWVPAIQRSRYKEIYRYFPYFHELEAM